MSAILATVTIHETTLDAETLEATKTTAFTVEFEDSDLEYSTDGSSQPVGQATGLARAIAHYLANNGVTEPTGRDGRYASPDGSFISNYATGERTEPLAEVDAPAEILELVAKVLPTL